MITCDELRECSDKKTPEHFTHRKKVERQRTKGKAEKSILQDIYRKNLTHYHFFLRPSPFSWLFGGCRCISFLRCPIPFFPPRCKARETKRRLLLRKGKPPPIYEPSLVSAWGAWKKLVSSLSIKNGQAMKQENILYNTDGLPTSQISFFAKKNDPPVRVVSLRR